MTRPLSNRAPALARSEWLAAQPEALQTDCQHLLCARLQCSRAELLRDGDAPLTPTTIAQLSADVARLENDEPLAYVLGEQPFHDIILNVDARVLVPRSDTEVLVEHALAFARERDDALRVLDLGTGSGAIALAMAHALPSLQITATDYCAQALAVAADNAARLGIEMQLLHSHWYQAVAGQFDLIVSNPPYIADQDPHLPGLRHEPLQALTAGRDGLDDLRQIVAQAPQHLYTGGMLMVEHGFDQAHAVHQLFSNAGFASVTGVRDLAGHARVTHGLWQSQ